MHSRYALAVVAAATALVAACSNSSSAPSTDGGDGSLARVRDAAKLVVCSSNDVPYFYRDPASNELAGTDYDLVQEVANRLQINTIELYEVPISGIIPALTSRRCDVISDNIAITLKRAGEVAFSAPMYLAGQAMVVPSGNPANILTEADFANHRVGSYQGTVQLDYLKGLAAKDPSIQVQEYKNITEIVADLEAGRLDAGAFDDMVARAMIAQNPDLQIEVVDYKMPIGDYAVGAAFRKEDNDLRFAFDDAYGAMMRDGTLRRILEKWELSPVANYQPFPGCCE